MNRVLGNATYQVWRQDDNLMISASGVLPCINENAFLEIISTTPPKCALYVIKQNFCLFVIKPFSLVASFGPVSDNEVIIVDRDGETKISAKELIRSKNWAAIENRQPIVNPGAVPFHVVGEVETRSGGLLPVLRKANPQDAGPHVLVLELSIEGTGVGTKDINYRYARYDERVVMGAYSEVRIRFEGKIVQAIKVQVVS